MVAPFMPDAEKLAAVRAALPAVGAGIYLDTVGAGPLPAEAAAAMAEIADWELRTGRASRDRHGDVVGRLDEARAAVAATLTVDLDDVVLCLGIEDALGRAMRAVDWQAAATLAYVDDPAFAGLPALAPPGIEAVAVADAEALAATVEGGRVGLAVMPLIDSGTGRRHPVKRVVEAARGGRGRILVDASLVVGAAPLDLQALGADLVVARADAWLLGPNGLAVVVTRPDLRAAVAEPHAASFHLPSLVGFGRACGWLSMYVGLPWLHEQGEARTGQAIARLGAVDGVEVLTPEAAKDRATTFVFRIDGWSADEALDELGARVFLIAAAVPARNAIRIGVGAWNTVEEIDRLADAVELLARHTPATIPPRRRLAILGEGR